MSFSTFDIIQLAMKYGGSIKTIIDEASSNDDIATKIKAISPDFVAILEEAGSKLFPNAAPELHLVGAVIATFDPNTTRWLQKGLNSYLSLNPPLVVDGGYGKKTKAAVEQLQEKFGLKVDGIAGQVTQGLLMAILAKIPNLSPTPVSK